MSSTRDLIERLKEIGATVKPVGGHLVLRAGPWPIPAELVLHIRNAKAEILAAIAENPANPSGRKRGATWWQSHFAMHTVSRQLGGARTTMEAQKLAFGDIVVQWHRRCGEVPDRRWCAGCGLELGDSASAVVLSDGARVHLGGVHRADCLIEYGRRWREAAVAALTRLGIDPPLGFMP